MRLLIRAIVTTIKNNKGATASAIGHGAVIGAVGHQTLSGGQSYRSGGGFGGGGFTSGQGFGGGPKRPRLRTVRRRKV